MFLWQGVTVFDFGNVFIFHGRLNLSILNSELRNFRHGHQERGEFVLAAVLNEHLLSIENWSQDD
ncbi:hypothetical protein EC23916_4266 [Escherichia coli 2.3916]|uniref:hypothetical protein n=1 Tax=Escherichia coli TaxID=562 RepID=UPI00025C9914|nr:hypothetical protein [Escherichia coli]EII49057.1 hypothetical protein EC23916_4266 [Escherichia coli 2.3916]